MKLDLMYYSDCLFFGGCENMIANLLNEQSLYDEFSVSFAFNYSDRYEQGLNSRISNNNYQKFPLKLLKFKSYHKSENSNSIFLFIHKSVFAIYLPLYKYYSILVNTILLYHFFYKKKIDILHINNGGFPGAYSCYSAVIAARFAGIRNIIYVVNNLAEDYKHPFRWLDYFVDFYIKKRVSLFVTASEYAGKRLKVVLKLGDDKHMTINNGIYKRAITLTKEEFKATYSFPKDMFIASVVANLEVRKGHIFLLKAILSIKRKSPEKLNSFFVFEGVGPEKKNLQKFITENNLTENVLMVDYIPHIFDLLNASDYAVLPSIEKEDFPNVVLEAMSLGKPVIGTEIAGIPEQIENGISGLVVKPRNSEELENAILRLTFDSGLIHRFSIEAKRRFDLLFEGSISVKNYLRLYKSFQQ